MLNRRGSRLGYRRRHRGRGRRDRRRGGVNPHGGFHASEPVFDFVLTPQQPGESLRDSLQPVIFWHKV